MYAYTRSQAIADGFQIDVSKIAAEAGIRFPVFITRGVYEQCVAVPLDGHGQPVAGQDDHDPRSGFKTWGIHLVADLGSQPGRLWDIVWMTRFAIIRMRGVSRRSEGRPTLNAQRSDAPTISPNRLPVALYVRNKPQAAQLVKLIAVCGLLDIDDPQPAITVMLPDED